MALTGLIRLPLPEFRTGNEVPHVAAAEVVLSKGAVVGQTHEGRRKESPTPTESEGVTETKAEMRGCLIPEEAQRISLGSGWCSTS